MNQSASLVEFAKAMVKAQGVLKRAQKDSTNPHFRSKYASFEAVYEACHEAYQANGIAIIQRCSNSLQGATVRTMLLHVSGEFVEDECFVPCAKPNDPHAMGSAITYARRYGLESVSGIVREDDDANAASNVSSSPPPPLGTEAVKQAAKPIQIPIANGQGGRTHEDISLKSNGAMVPISIMSDKDLAYWAKRKRESIDDPEKARFHASDARDLACINAEQRFRATGK